MGFKEGSCDKHWELYVSDGSLNSISETKITLYVNYPELKQQFLKK